MNKQGTLELSPEVRGLLDNGMDFLEKAQIEFASSPTHSIVSFWTAVEILLKVPLAHEHWSLVCSGRKIVRNNYLSGNFQSVTFEEACDRLDDALGKPLPEDTKKAFNIIRKHRNRVVHFYHNAYTDEAKSQLLAEQADAWFALNRLMREDWKDLFEGALGNYLARQETRLITTNAHYAGIRFKKISGSIKKLEEDGARFTQCSECKTKAAVVDDIRAITGFKIRTSHCLVCAHSSERFVSFKCPQCEKTQKLYAGHHDMFKCKKCMHTVSRYELLDTSSYTKDDYDSALTPAGCSECLVHNTVCEFGEGYLCTHCLTYHESLEQCGTCSHHSTTVPEMSTMGGCEFCDGPPSSWPDDE